jgi:hypothetical protein
MTSLRSRPFSLFMLLGWSAINFFPDELVRVGFGGEQFFFFMQLDMLVIV